MSFKLLIVAPTGIIFEDQVDSVFLPGAEGSFEIYTGHMPLVSTLKQGQVRVRQHNQESGYEITSGVVEVDMAHQVTLLADQMTAIK
ncbi:MAG: ATP synthase F1 subunit epsilon [Candidatus Omnitrophica bacterium]|nr:ATP synthase F1 subunit epsilon [Candidatus Omnitrophota bacterium]